MYTSYIIMKPIMQRPKWLYKCQISEIKAKRKNTLQHPSRHACMEFLTECLYYTITAKKNQS